MIAEAQYSELTIVVREYKGEREDNDNRNNEVGRWSSKVLHLLRSLKLNEEGQWLPLTNRVGDLFVKFDFYPVALELQQEESITSKHSE